MSIRHASSPQIRVAFALLLALGAGAGKIVRADTFTVTNTANAGVGSLRQAMLDANAKQVTDGTQCAGHRIAFDIPGPGPHTIQPLSPLPVIHIPMTFDGYSQPGSSRNTQAMGSNAVIGIEIDGSLAGNTDAFVVAAAFTGSGLCAGNTSIFGGLVINRFAGAAISMGEETCPPNNFCTVGGVLIYGAYIGTDVTGTQARGNGIVLGRAALVFGTSSTSNVVGEHRLDDGGSSDPHPELRNVISGNGGDAILIASTSSSFPAGLAQAHTIRNNYIGLDANGTAAVPNGGRGVELGLNTINMQIYDNLIGANAGDGVAIFDSLFPATNVIGNGIGIGVTGQPFGNGGYGVYVGNSATGVSVGARWRFAPVMAAIANNADAGVFVDGTAIVDAGALSSAHNGGLAFDIAPTGLNPNDPGDADTGPNERLNRPVIDSATGDSGSQAGSIAGSLDAVPNSTYEIHFFYSATCDAGGFGGGEVPYGLDPPPSIVSVTTDASGHAAFSRSANFLPVGKVLTAVARGFSTTASPSALISSEYSNCATIVGSDLIFANGFE